MGHTQSTPLGLILNHFKDFRWVAEDSDLVVCPSKLAIFYRDEGPIVKVGWPDGETFHLPTVCLQGEVYSL